MLKTLTSGNEVITTGGLMGKVTSVTEHYAAIEISEGVEIKIQKSSVSAIVPKGTIDAA
jgi:preprotein translocase subunit YajC